MLRFGALFFVFMFWMAVSANAQKTMADTNISFFALGGELGLHTAFGDLGDRFGYGGLVGGSVLYKSVSNWTIEGNYGFIFGNQVKEDTILKPLFTEQNFIIGRDGSPADILLYERGFLATARLGRIIPIIGPNPNSGIHFAVGGGMMYHKIRIRDEFETAPQIAGDYVKGYDRQTFGFALSQSIGYQHFSDYRLWNFYAGIEVYEGFTKNRRTINFDTGLPDNKQRLDIIGTFVLRWYFPIYKRQPKEFYFY